MCMHTKIFNIISKELIYTANKKSNMQFIIIFFNLNFLKPLTVLKKIQANRERLQELYEETPYIFYPG